MIERSAVEAARERVVETARHTPLQPSYTFSVMTGADIFLKLENFQRTGSFKIRGATNKIQTLEPEEKQRGVVTASAGNHGQGVALAASRIGVNSTVVMPEDAPISKVKATENYGAKVVLHGQDYDEAAEHAHEIEAAENRTYVHAFDDPDIIAGQGTIGLEIIEDCPSVDTIVVPIGGGGLISGIIAAIAQDHPDIRIIGVQAEGASSVVDSLNKGERVQLSHVDTMADGIATRRIGQLPFEMIASHVDEIVTVPDAEIAMAVVYLLERSKTLVEGAGAVSLAAVLFDRFSYNADETIVPIISGGNIDLNTLTTVIMRGLVETGHYLKIRTVLEDRPGSLEEFIEIMTANRANIYAIQHDRTSRNIGMGDAEIEVDLETRGHDHVEELIVAIESHGFDVEVLV